MLQRPLQTDGTPISTLHITLPARRTAILESATRTFAMLGLRGSSLRDIARDAGVSLTLLDHHFGSKAMLLKAVVGFHKSTSMAKIAPLRASLMALDGALTLQRLVDEWVDYEFGLSDLRQGRHDLHLVLRLTSDPDVDFLLKEGIDCAEGVIVEALRRINPQLSETQLKCAWTLASSPLYALVLAVDGSRHREKVIECRAAAKAFIARGLDHFAVHDYALTSTG